MKNIQKTLLVAALFASLGYVNARENNTFEKDTLMVVRAPNGEMKSVVLNVVVTGFANLYYSKEGGDITFYAQKQGDDIYEINKKFFEPFLKVFFSDCDKVFFSKLEGLFYDKLTLSNLFQKYNNCMDKGSTTVIHTYPRVGHSFKSGINISDYSDFLLDNGVYVPLNAKYRYIGGYAFSLLYSDFISLQTELMLSIEGANSANKKLSFKSTNIQVPFFIKINFSKGKVKPYLMAGTGINFPIYKESYFETPFNLTEDIKNPVKYNNNIVSYLAGAGLAFKYSKDNEIYFEIRYDRNVINKGSFQEMKDETFQVLVGIMLF